MSVLALAALCGAAAGTALGSQGPRLVVVHGFGEDHPVRQGVARFREKLAGVATVEIRAHGDDAAALRALLAGRADVTVVSPAALRDILREVTLLDLMGLWRDRAHWERALDGEPGRLLAALARGGSRPAGNAIRILDFWGGTRRHIVTRRGAAPTIEALAAARLGIPMNPVRSKMWRVAGVRPVLLPPGDGPAALRDGTVDGIEEEAEAILDARLYQVAPHLTETGHAIATRLLILAEAAWGGLGPLQRAALAAAAREATTLARAAEARREAEALAALRGRLGVTIHPFAGGDALRARTLPLRRRYAEELGVGSLLSLIEKAATP